MNRELVFLSAQPDETYFYWQTEVFINNVRALGYQQEIRVLLFYIGEKNPMWTWLEAKYKDANVKVFWYKDTEDFASTILDYTPLLRAYIFEKHFTEYPELTDKAIFYHDSDIIFTQRWDLDKYLSDDVQYLSDASTYIGASYFESRWKWVKPAMLDEYRTQDVLGTACKIIGIDRDLVRKNEYCSGGAQHILKNIDAKFWKNVREDAAKLRIFFQRVVTPTYFENETEGFNNGWCAEMWALLWNLWKRGDTTSCPKDMDFSWPQTPISDRKNIHHDTGVTKDQTNLFDKRKIEYLKGLLVPYGDDLSFVSDEYCSSLYVKAIQDVTNKHYS